MLWGLLGGLWVGMLVLYILYYRNGKEEKKRVGAVVLAVIFMVVVLIAASGQKSSGVGAARYTYYINGVRVGRGFAAFSGNLLGAVGSGLVAAWTAKGLGYIVSRFGKNGEGISGKNLMVIGIFTILFGLILAIIGLIMSAARGPGAMSYREAGRILTIVGSVPLVPGALCVVFGKKKL